jgi:hypothetical protein
MAPKAPTPSRHPAGIPASGGAKYVVVGIALLVLMGGAIVWKMSQKPPEPVVVTADAGNSAPPPKVMGRNPEDDVPPPPPIEDASAPEKGTKVATGGQASGQCAVPKCNGSAGADLENALSFRVKQSHRCYDNALAQDATLRGKLTVAVRIGANGQACSAGVVSNDMGSQSVASCVSGYFRGANFPAPKGGCVDVNIPINFVPRQ